MKAGVYVGKGRVEVREIPEPEPPNGGLLVQTEACGLCSGELMDWYMDGKAPHVLGHEVAGIVIESDDARFPVGTRVAPHHHAPCMNCDLCRRGAHVHCRTWKATQLSPGGMAERFAVPAANLCDTWDVSDLRPIDAALVEPLGCVVKSLRKLNPGSGEAFAVVGLGVMGLLHMLLVDGAVGYDTNPARVEWARGIGLDARSPETNHLAESVVVCPGTPAALEYGLRLAAPDSKVMLFAPMTPGPPTPVPLNDLYFRDVTLLNSYSCGPEDTRQALELLRRRSVRAEQVVSHFVELDELPEHYEFMKIGRELKPMVVFT